MKPKYNPSMPIRCASNFSVSYMLLSNDKVRMSVGKHPKSNKEVEGNGLEFETLEIAREYAYNKGYIVYDEELGKESKKSLNKNK